MNGEFLMFNLTIDKQSIRSYMILIFYIFLSGGILFLSNSIILDIIALIILVLGAVSIVKFDLAHPYVWFSIVFLLYSISYPILYLNNQTYDVYTYTPSLIFIQWLALASFLLALGPTIVNFSKLYQSKKKMISSNLILFLMSFAIIVTIFEISTGGYTHKSEMYASGSISISIGFRVALAFIIVYAINSSIYAFRNNKLDIKLSLYSFLLIFFMFFFSGERDLLIRLFVVVLFIYYIIIKKSKLSKEVIIFGLLTASLIPILSSVKYFGLTGEVTTSEMNFFLEFLNSDFQSASKNMQILLINDTTEGIFQGSTFISALLRSFHLDKLFGINVVSSLQWYNESLFSENRAGQGFTMVGDGYLNFGYMGVILLFVFIGLLMKIIYKNSNKGIYHFVFYIISIPTFMYSIRADLANLLSPLIKQNLLIILLIKLIIEIVYYSHNSKRSKHSRRL